MRPITELTGRYHLEELIAAGGMGEVWRAADQVLARPVAVKLLRPEYTHDEVTLARFRAEAQHAGLLNHPGIAQVYDYRDAGPESPAYLVMELVAGPSLAAVLASGRLEPARSADVMAQAAAALGAAHAAGVLHRDIKPANLLITCDGQVKVTDFGIAHSARTENLTSTGALIGTMGYLAPERVSGSSATAASDLYALGIVGYECLTGQPPFRGEPLQVALAHRDQDLPEFPPWCLRQPGGGELAALIADLTAKDPAARPATAAEVAARARHIRDGLTGRPGVSAAPSPAAPSPAGPSPAGPSPAGPSPAGPSPAAPSPAATAIGTTPGGPIPGSTAATGGTTPSPARDDGPAASAWPSATPRPRPRHRVASALGLTLGIIAAGLLGWQLALAQHSPAQPAPGSPGRHPTGTPARSAAAVRTVGVSASLAGRPVAVVRRELLALGLRAEVRTEPDRQAAPGTVLRLHPTGQVRLGSVILVTAATQPAPARRVPPAPAPGGPAGRRAAGGKPVPPGHAKHGKGQAPAHG